MTILTEARAPPSGSGSFLPQGERVYAIGDIHGRLDLLDELVAAIRADNADRAVARVKIVLLGDIVDRGDDSAELVRQCMALTKRSSDFVVLKGNHEEMMVHTFRGSKAAMHVWLSNGGEATLYSWGVAPEILDAGNPARILAAMRTTIPRDVIDWLDRLPIHYRSGGYFFVHAGVRPGVPLERQKTEDLLWIKDDFTEDRTAHPLMIVHGHSERLLGPEILPNRIGIDTGAYQTDVLTALGLEDARTWTLQTGGRQKDMMMEQACA